MGRSRPQLPAIFTLIIASAALAQPDIPLEGPSQPRLAPPHPAATSPPARVEFPGFISVQVNVDPLGNNILNDAANEPSIAVDPTAPNRMAIGWRQFDAIQSNFRQAGYGWTNDGGRSWHADKLTPGTFRSDPVLRSNLEGVFYYYSLRSSFLCDMFISEDGGQSWGPPIPAFGGDKAWFTIDTTGGPADGHIYIAWSTAGNPFSPNQFTRSTDGGFTWSQASLLPDPKPRWGTLDVNAGGDLFLSGTSSAGFRALRSGTAKEPGAAVTWDQNVQVSLGGTMPFGSAGSPNPAGLLGQVTIAADRSGGPLHGNIYMLATVNPPGPEPTTIHFSRSSDGGTVWSAPVRINDDPASENNWHWFGTMSVAPDGRIDVVWNDTRNSGKANISELFYSHSTDGGMTWSKNEPISPAFDSWLGWPQQNKLGDYYDMHSDLVGANLAWAATFNGEQDVYYLRIGDYDCNGNGVGDAIDIATGAAPDCNRNGIPDSCEIAAGAAKDVNGNGIPDECELCYADCDLNFELNIEDFLCFQLKFALQDPYADCDGNGVWNIDDFICFQTAYCCGC